jgi:hypothetical protein
MHGCFKNGSIEYVIAENQLIGSMLSANYVGRSLNHITAIWEGGLIEESH